MKYTKTISPPDLESKLFKQLNKFEMRFLNEEENGTPSRYEVRVDGVRVIGPTRSAEDFANVLDFIDLDDTEKIEVRIYHGESRTNDKYTFTLFREVAKTQPLNGPGSVVHFEVEKVKQELAFEQLKKDYDELVAEVKEQNKYVDELEAELDNFRSKRFYLGDVNLLDVGGVILEGVIKRNAGLLGSIAAGGSPGLGGPSQPEQEVDPELIEVCTQIQNAFSEEDLEHLMELLNVLAENPYKLPQTLAFAGQPEMQNH